jgi:TM2 domain-containing membrane protein YozV
MMPVFCTKCGFQNDEYTPTCLSCQAPLPNIGGYQPIQPPVPMYGQPPAQDWKQAGGDKKIIGGILAIILGGLGVHKFMLGYQREGVIMLLVSVLSCGVFYPVMHIIGIVEGIMYLTKTDEDFVKTYLIEKKGWF